MNSHAIGVVTALLAGLAMGVGYAAVVQPLAAVGILTLLFGGAVVWLRPLWGLALMTGLIAVEGSLLLEGGSGVTSVTRLLGMGVAGAWFLRKLVHGESWDRLLRSPVLVLLSIFLCFVALSSLWAKIVSPVPGEMFRLLMFVAFPVLIVDLVRSRADAGLLVKAIVLGGTIAAVMTLLQLFGPTYMKRAGEGVTGSINQTAFLLTCLVPLAFYLVRGDRFPWTLLGLLYILLAPLAVAGTFSRMSLLLVSAVLSVELFHSVVRGRGRGIMIMMATAAGVAALVFVLPTEQVMPRLQARIETIRPYIESTLNRPEGGIVEASPRGFHIQVAFAIFRDHPWVGAGYRNYPHLFLRDYQTEQWGAGGMVYRTPRSSHGTLWGFLAELGLVGTGIWLIMLGVALVGIMRTMWTLDKHDDEAARSRALCRGVLLLMILLGGYHLSADIHLRKIFWLGYGLAVAIPRALRSEQAGQEPEPLPATVPTPRPALQATPRPALTAGSAT